MTKRAKKPWIGYPGSPVQQNYGEAVEHGFLLWDIESRDSFDVRFCNLPNPKPYVTVEWVGNVAKTVKAAREHPLGSRFRIRCRDVLPQDEAVTLTDELQRELCATEVTFKNDRNVDHDVISAGTSTLVKQDLRNVDVLMKLLREYHGTADVTDAEWDATREAIVGYLGNVLVGDEVVRNTKWTLHHLDFDNVFAYGPGNSISFDKLPGIVGVFGPNRTGKSSIVGAIMYALFNSTDRGSIKNMHVVNVRHPYCFARAIVGVNGVDYVIERQTTKSTSRGRLHANTVLNVFRVGDDSELVDLAGEERKDTDKVIRQLLGNVDDCLMTSVASQDDVKQFINLGSTKRRQALSRFLDLDVFDRMHDLARDDVNSCRAELRALPDVDNAGDRGREEKLDSLRAELADRVYSLNDTNSRLDAARQKLLSFKGFTPVTSSQVEEQRKWVMSLAATVKRISDDVMMKRGDIELGKREIVAIDDKLRDGDVASLRTRLEAFRELEASLDALKKEHERDAQLLKQQERSLKILDDVPCGDEYPTCKFIKDAHKNRERVGPQRDRVQRVSEKLQRASDAVSAMSQEDVHGQLEQLERLQERKLELSSRMVQLETDVAKKETDLEHVTQPKLLVARTRLRELEIALQNEENLEVAALRNDVDALQRETREADAEKLRLAAEVGRVQSDIDRAGADKAKRDALYKRMRVHDLVCKAFSRKGLPSMITSSQLPLINAEVSQVLQGIVDFSVEVEVDSASDDLEVYINYGDSRRPVELGSGMEKTVAAIAIRVALINVSSLPKADVFIVDEAFGPMDPASVEACNRLLVSLKKHFRSIVVITHVEGIKDVADHVIEVQRVEKDARVMVQ